MDDNLPPGTTERDIAADAYYLRCVGCGRDFPAAELDWEELCARCREDDGDNSVTEEKP